jgi:putative transposase
MLRALIETEHPELSVTRQCELLGLARSSFYYQPAVVSAEQLALMRDLDRLYTRWPFYGSRRLAWALRRQGHEVGRKRVQSLMRTMGLEAIYPKPRLSAGAAAAQKYPYLLRGLRIERPNQVWAVDITYVPLAAGFLYLVALLDWFSRYVLAWRLSNTLETAFCLEALEEALSQYGVPEIHNNDQGVQFTSAEYVGRVQAAGAQVSWDGRGRVYDNIFVERLWRSVKYEHVYLHEHADGEALASGLGEYFPFYNHQRPHQALEYRPPAELYFGKTASAGRAGRKTTR